MVADVTDQIEAPAGFEDRLEHRLEQIEPKLFPIVAALVVVGGVAWLLGSDAAMVAAFAIATTVALIPALIESVRQLIHRDATADVVAVLAMLGALLLQEWLAGAIIAVMLTGGEALEARAVGRARAELTGLLQRAPRTAHRQGASGDLTDIDVDEVRAGDVLVVKVGEVVPVDGMLLSDRGVLDEAALTGESVPAEVAAGQVVRSGVVNAGGPLQLRATATAEASTYAGVVRLVEQAATERAPFVRVADRFAGIFLAVTLVLATAAWILSGDPVRALAVLVVATPCPLILAAPAAIVGGVSAAAKRGIIVKGGSALEALASGTTVLLDKTGTVTSGRPRVAQVHPVSGFDATELLRFAGSLDQVSVHPFAPAIVEAAHARGGDLEMPTDVEEVVGQGIGGRVGGHSVRVGQLDYAAAGREPSSEMRRVRRRGALEGRSIVYVAVDEELVGAIALHDPIRPDTPRSIQALRDAGIEHVLMVTGDRAEIAELVGDTIGVDRVLAEHSPDEKVDAVREASRYGNTIMVGDGINDAPALALASAGVAMGARGATAASEAADVVLTSDRLDGVADAVVIARRTRRIAWQSAVTGIGLSAVAMVFAALGYLTPVAGAIVQEVIDLAVLFNALRALRVPARGTRRLRAIEGFSIDLVHDHDQFSAGLEDLGLVAGQLDRYEPAEAAEALTRIRDFLVDDLLPAELEEERTVYPALRVVFDQEDPTSPLVRTHREIARRIRLFDRLVDDIGSDGPDRDEVLDLQRSLFGLHAVLEFHLALEQELYSHLPRGD
ncbi:MAG: heavy metal translocating P-type ATPase [Nitriliruptoraceae bacterium]